MEVAAELRNVGQNEGMKITTITAITRLCFGTVFPVWSGSADKIPYQKVNAIQVGRSRFVWPFCSNSLRDNPSQLGGVILF